MNKPVRHFPRSLGSLDLCRAVRARFVAQGTTLNAWCQVNGVARQTAENALKGLRNSERSRELARRIIAASFEKASVE